MASHPSHPPPTTFPAWFSRWTFGSQMSESDNQTKAKNNFIAFPISFPEMRELLRQRLMSAIEPRRHRPHRTTQRLGHLLVRQVLEIFQHDRHPQLRL